MSEPLFDIIDRMQRETRARDARPRKRSPLVAQTGEELKALGMEQVMRATAEEYKRSFELTLMAFLPGTQLTIEDVTNACGRPPAGHWNVCGSLMSKLARKGLIQATFQRRTAQRRLRHAAKLTVWVRTEKL